MSAQDHGKAPRPLPPSSLLCSPLSLSFPANSARGDSFLSSLSSRSPFHSSARQAAMASGGRRRKPRGGGASSRPKPKKRTKYLSLSRIIVKSEVHTPPRTPHDDDDDDCGAPEPSAPPSPAPWEEEEEQAEVKQEQAEVKQEEDGGGGSQPQQQAEPPFAPVHHEASTLFAALPAPSLSDILGASAGTGGGDGESSSPSASPEGFAGAEEDLARRALRGRERWVYCCSSSSSPSPTANTATTSSSSPCSSSAASTGASARSLLLKLDYDDILAAWADRGSLYIAHAARKQDEGPESEPELDNVLVEVEPSPQQHATVTVKVEPPQQPAAAAWSTPPPETAWSERAESVRRYREKRRNRLFAHRIRYEVRRVNAVKRPRFKGRFIKHEEIEV